MSDNRRYWLWFSMALYPGNERIWEMISPFGNVKDAYYALCGGSHDSLSSSEKNALKTTHIEQCDSVIEYCESKGYYILTYEDENYPILLRNIYNPPAVLFCMGDIRHFNSYPAVSCVGTRKPSKYSVEVASKICAELAKREFTIVSGFALGLDSVAHRAALESRGRTAAVLACGLDYDYPRENAEYKSIIAANGLVITEYFPGTRPSRSCFHLRNRIISGLTFGTIVLEADESSGSLITAMHAAEQGRTVFCVPPGDIFDKRYSGVIKYLRDGAIPVFSHLDVIYDYFSSGCFRKFKADISLPKINTEDNDIPKKDSRTAKRKKSAVKDSNAKSDLQKTDSRREELLGEMSGELTAIVNCLDDAELQPDEISIRSGIDSLNILAYLTELEMMGAVEMKEGKKYGLTKAMQKNQ